MKASCSFHFSRRHKGASSSP